MRDARGDEMRICMMVEGQEGVSWHEWRALARVTEDAGLEGLFRSDHYLSFSDPAGRGALDAWTTLAGIAAVTERIRLGTLVSPATFRHPSVLSKSVVTVDHISNGRVELGIGAGWFREEHRGYGFPFPGDRTRVEMLEEQIEIVHREWSDGPFDFDGRHYRVEALEALPKPVQQPRPNLIVGGSGGKRSVSIAARWADEYNIVYATPQKCSELRDRVARAWAEAGRREDPVFSLMTGCVVGSDAGDLDERVGRIMKREGEDGSPRAWLEGRPEGWLVGTVEQVVDRIGGLSDAGVDRLMLQHQDHADVDMVSLIGDEVLPRLP